MKTVKLNLSELVFPEQNVRIHTEIQIKEFIRSLEMFGQIRPIIIDEKNTILVGNGLAKAMIQKGDLTADCIIKESLTENQKKKLMIADNKIFSLGLDDVDALYKVLEELTGDLDIPGFDEEILNSMFAEAEEVTEKIYQYGFADDETVRTINNNIDKKQEMIEKERNSQNEEQNIVFDNRNSENSYTQENNNTESNKYEEETTGIKKYAECPKCGEKIWL